MTATPAALAATEAEKLKAIQDGLAHLHGIQQAAGSWSYGGYEQAATGAAAFAFLTQKDKWGADASQYQAAVDQAIAYLLSTASTVTVSARNDGVNICPGGSGSCPGVYWYGAGESTYTTGLIAPAIAAYGASAGAASVATTSGPLAGMTWAQIAQGITNGFAASQSTAVNGNRRGGWRYYIPGNGDSDSSTTQWAVISLIYDKTLGAMTPQAVVDDLKVWLANVQSDPSLPGAVCYQPGLNNGSTNPCDTADTGGWLLAMSFVGEPAGNARIQAALGFLNGAWRQTANSWYGNFGHPYAMWSVYKGLETNIGLDATTGITDLLTTCGAPGNLPGSPPGSRPCNWWEDYNEWIVRNQASLGVWPGYWYWTDPLSTAFYVGILGATQIPVGVDGVCGSANGQGFVDAPTIDLCSAGTASAVTGSGPWSWTCAGANGGTTASCSAPPQVNGACGAANGQSFVAAPTADLCSAGTASAVTGSGPWSWTCAGENGGTAASCSAAVRAANRCPRSQGFWKNHPAAWPSSCLTLGGWSYTKDELLAILRTSVGAGRRADASLILAHQLIAALLNVANGSDPSPIVSALDQANGLLGGHGGALPYQVAPASGDGAAMVATAATLDRYNNQQSTCGCKP